MNSPPIEMLATKPMMIMLMQGGMVSAITAVRPAAPAASFGSWRGAAHGRHDDAADRGDVGQLGAGHAGEEGGRDDGDQVQAAAHAAEDAQQQLDQPRRHAVRLPSAGRPARRTESPAARSGRMPGHHLLRVDEHRQRRIGQEVEQRREGQHEARSARPAPGRRRNPPAAAARARSACAGEQRVPAEDRGSSSATQPRQACRAHVRAGAVDARWPRRTAS